MSRPPSAESGIYGKSLAGADDAPLLFSPGNAEEVIVRLCSNYGLHIHTLWYCYMPDGMRCKAQQVQASARQSVSLPCPPEPRAIMDFTFGEDAPELHVDKEHL